MNIIGTSIVVGAAITILDAHVDAYFAGNGFVEELLHPHVYETVERAMFVLFSILVGICASRLIRKLKKAQREVNALEGILPICSSCKQIRDKEDKWQPIEIYVRDRSEAEFTHGICPECRDKLYGDYFKTHEFGTT